MKALLPSFLGASLALILTTSFAHAAPPIPDNLKTGRL